MSSNTRKTKAEVWVRVAIVIIVVITIITEWWRQNVTLWWTISRVELLNSIPTLFIWAVALVLSSILVRKNHGKPERLMLIGTILMFINAISSIPEYLIKTSLTFSDIGPVQVSPIIPVWNMFWDLCALAGIILIFIAVWKKFSNRTTNECEKA